MRKIMHKFGFNCKIKLFFTASLHLSGEKNLASELLSNEKFKPKYALKSKLNCAVSYEIPNLLQVSELQRI